MISKISFYAITIPLLLGLALATVDEGTYELGAADFSYRTTGSDGPRYWGKLKPAFKPCSSGKHQSPVNINENEAVLNKNLKPLSMDYAAAANATLFNLGSMIELHYDGNIGGMEIYGKNYTFKQMHWHSPAEHLIGGKRYEAELHLVHEAEDGSSALTSILYRYGNSAKEVDPLLAQLEDGLEKLANNEVFQIPVGRLDTKHMTRNTRKYYRYIGSLTTPPCTENAIWTLLSEVGLISREQVAALKAPLAPENKDNARPEQQLNGRKIELYYDELRF